MNRLVASIVAMTIATGVGVAIIVRVKPLRNLVMGQAVSEKLG